MRNLVLTCAALLGVATTAASTAEPDAAAVCVYLTHHDGVRYALAYAGRRCTRDGYEAVPRDRYDALASWSFNANHAGIISAIDHYRILARLATLDDRSTHGRYNIHSDFKRWSDYKWADHATFAYLTALDALGRSPVITGFLEAPLLRLGFATKQNDRIELKQRRVSPAEKPHLLRLLATAEAELAKEARMRAVPRTLEEAAREVPSHEEARRRNLGVFRLD